MGAFAPVLISIAMLACLTLWKSRVIFADVNVLIYAFRKDSVDHKAYLSWLQEMMEDSSYRCSDFILSAFVRIVTNPRTFQFPTSLKLALEFTEAFRNHSNAVAVAPGPRHWDLFTGLCRKHDAKGNLIPDAYLAALAIESGSEWITTDKGFSRYSGLRWRHPLDP
jgi:toxin-antitoxin system PIN domain toxin